MKHFYVVAAFTVFFLLIVFPGTAQTEEPIYPTLIGTGIFLGETPPLRDLPALNPADLDNLIREREKRKKMELNEGLNQRSYPHANTALPKGPDPLWQKTMGGKGTLSNTPIQNFSGQTTGSLPPDCNGTVGPNHYMQTVNLTYAIYSKTGTLLAGPTAMNTLFGSVTGANNNDGDPIILYDEQASRWLAVEFSISGSNDYMLIAVSKTNDPTGSWYTYSFDVEDVPDYEKFGIWQDGYYMGVNNSSGNDIYVFQRSVLLAGGANPQMIGFDNPNRPTTIDGFVCVPPADNDGAYAPTGAPGIFIAFNDDAIGGGTDQLWIYELTANWTTPESSTFTRIQQINVGAFDSNFGANWDNISQPGTTQQLDAIPQVIMNVPQYRNFGTYQTLVCCHTVDVDATDHAGIRWYELRRGTQTSGNWTIRQEGTYAPDAHSRWMGSIMLNGNGKIGLGYSISSSTVYPGIRYAGQSSTAYAAASGILDIAEETIQNGSYSQTGENRWGDYSLMAVDPADDQTFWFTTEYMLSESSHGTKIASFRLNSTLQIITPNGGEVFALGSSMSIKWQELGGSTQFVKIELLKNGVSVKTIASSVESKPGDNTYNWNVDPGSGQQGVDFKLKITSQSNSQNFDLSDNNFIINKGGTTITFSGIKWQISNGRKTPGDGCNYWFDGFINGQNVYNLVSVDGSGNLHLKIKKIGNHWYCPELESLHHFGYGEYRYYVSSNLNYDPKVVAGLFSYESDTKEIDLEFHHWPTNIFCSDRQGNYIVQHPPNTCFHLNPYEVNWHKFEVPSNTQTTHKYTWSSGDVHFQSYLGHTPTLVNNPDLIDDWTTPCWESWIPAPGASHVMLNFWMTAAAPDNGATEMELVIAAVKIPQPDLVIENASVSQSPVVPGTPVFVSYLLNNKGDGNAGTSVTRILYSRDNVVSSDDTELALETEGAVAPGAGILHYKQVVIPASATYGSRYLILIADKSNLVPEESNETNNTTLIPITVGAAYSTLTVNVFNVPGGSAALPGSNAYVSLIKPNGSSFGLPVRTNSNGVAVFTNVLNAASYKISVYYDPSPATIHGKEFWGEKTPVNIFANTTVDFTRNNPYESAPIKVFYSNNTPVTGPVPPGTVLKLKTVATNPNSASKTVKTRLVIDADLSTPYSIDQESSPKTVAPGQSLENEFTFMPTVGGNYYATVGTKMSLTSSSYTVTDGWAWPANPTIIVVAPSSPLTVIVHNVPGGITTIPGINGVVKVLTASGSVVASQSTNSSHTAYFPSIPNGSNYTIRVYHNPATTLFGQEYWGGMTGITVNGSQTINFTRNQPYELEYLRFYKKDGTEVPAGSTIPTGTTLTVKAKVLNPNASPLPAKARIVIDQNSYSPYDFDQESVQQQVIQSGQSAIFAFNCTPTLTGSYYATVGVKSNSTGAMIISDGWEWPATAAFVVDGPSSALSVTVQNIDGTSVPIPGSHGSVDLIKSNGSTIASPTTNLNGIAFFQNVPTGNSYSIKTYHTPLNPTTIFGKEYWGGTGGINIPGTSAVTFQRNMPHGIDWVRVYDGNDEITGMTVPEGTYTVKFTVKNPNPQSQVVALNLVADHSRSAPYEFNSTTPSYTIPANGTRTFEVPLTFTVEHQGGYYIVSGTVTTVGGNATITDGWAWYSSPSIFIDPGCNSTSISPASLLVPTTSWQSVSYDHAGYFSKFYVTKGSAYTWSLCPADGATANFDSELTLRKADDDTLIVYNDANCSSGNNAKINWVATFTGTVKVITTQWRCATNSLPVVLKYKKTSKDEEDFPGPEDHLIKIYPNPTAGKQTIDLHEVLPSEVSYELVDMRGTTIHNYTVHREGLNDIIDLSSLPSGMYLLRIKAGDYRQLSKIVLQK